MLNEFWTGRLNYLWLNIQSWPTLWLTRLMMNLLHNDVFVIAFAIAKWWFQWGFLLCDDRFPASGTNFCFTTIRNSWSSGFKMATSWRKCPPAVLRDGFLTAQAWKMATPMEDLRWTVSFQPIGTHWGVFNAFQWAFLFRFTMFSLYRDFAWMN